MSNDPHRDALAAAIARVVALEQENHELRQGGGAQPSALSTAEELALSGANAGSRERGWGAPPSPTEGPDSIDFGAVQALVDETLANPLAAKAPTGRGVPAVQRKKEKAKPERVKCPACSSPRTSGVVLAASATLIAPSPGVAGRVVQKLRDDAGACADCGQVTFRLSEEDRAWLRENHRGR